LREIAEGCHLRVRCHAERRNHKQNKAGSGMYGWPHETKVYYGDCTGVEIW
jgi:hypothetical protein